MTNEEKEVKRMHMQLLEQDCYIDATKDIEYPPLALSMGEQTIQTKTGLKTYPIPLGTYGNFSFVQAPPKSKKNILYITSKRCLFKRQLRGYRRRNERTQGR